MEDPLLNQLEEKFPRETAVLGGVFEHTTNSYKLLWFKAILSLLPYRDSDEIAISDLLREMVVIAWHTVTFFRLSLGRQDQVDQVINTLREKAPIEANASTSTIREVLESDKTFDDEIARLGEYVPERFLTPWFAQDLRGLPDSRKNATIIGLADQSFASDAPPMYCFAFRHGQRVIRIHKLWRAFLVENAAVMRAFADFHLVQYLQRRNPSTPAIIEKLWLPPARELTYARRFWETVRKGLLEEGHAQAFCDIYSGETLDRSFSIDHFVPWSFVMHDLIWNLTPVEASTNSSKGDRVPNVQVYLDPFARLHHQATRFAKSRGTVSDMYIECFRKDVTSLATMTFEEFRSRVEDVIVPLAKVAGNQGFETGWVFHMPN